MVKKGHATSCCAGCRKWNWTIARDLLYNRIGHIGYKHSYSKDFREFCWQDFKIPLLAFVKEDDISGHCSSNIQDMGGEFCGRLSLTKRRRKSVRQLHSNKVSGICSSRSWLIFKSYINRWKRETYIFYSIIRVCLIYSRYIKFMYQ